MKRVMGDTGLSLSNQLTPVGYPPVQLLIGLSNTDIVMKFVNRKDGTTRVGNGTVTISDYNAGTFIYQFSDTDLSIPGLFDVYPVITTPSGPAHFISQLLEITDTQ